MGPKELLRTLESTGSYLSLVVAARQHVVPESLGIKQTLPALGASMPLTLTRCK